MTTRPNVTVTTEQARQLAALAGLAVAEARLPSLSARLQAIRDGAAMIDSLPLDEIEPATAFRPASEA